MRQGQTWILVLSGMAFGALWLSRDLLTGLVFGWGDITARELGEIADLTAIYAISLVPLGLNVFIRRVLNAVGDTRSPMIGEGLGFLAFLLAALAVKGLDGSLVHLMLAAVFGAFVSGVYLLRMASVRDVPMLAMLGQPSTWLTALLAFAVMALPVLAEQQLPDGGTVTAVMALLLGGICGTGVAIAVNRDARAAVSGLRRRQ